VAAKTKRHSPIHLSFLHITFSRVLTARAETWPTRLRHSFGTAHRTDEGLGWLRVTRLMLGRGRHERSAVATALLTAVVHHFTRTDTLDFTCVASSYSQPPPSLLIFSHITNAHYPSQEPDSTRRARTPHVQLTASTHHPSTNQPYAYRYTFALPSGTNHHRYHHFSLTLTPPTPSIAYSREEDNDRRRSAGGHAIAGSQQSWVRALHSLCVPATTLLHPLSMGVAHHAGDGRRSATCYGVKRRRTTSMTAVF
jgi:hypothetical protein